MVSTQTIIQHINRQFEYKINNVDDVISKKYKVGVITNLINSSEKQIAQIIYKKITLLKEYGFDVQETDINYSDFALASYYIIATAEASSNLSRFDNIRYGFDFNPEGYEWNSYSFSSSFKFWRRSKKKNIGWIHLSYLLDIMENII